MTNHALSALITKRAELAGHVAALQAQIDRIQGDMATLDGAIRLLDPDAAPERIRPKRYRPPGPKLFGWKELPRLIMAVLRDANQPLGSMEIARQIMARRGMQDNAAMLKRIENMVDGRLRRREGKMVERAWNGRELVWRVAN